MFRFRVRALLLVAALLCPGVASAQTLPPEIAASKLVRIAQSVGDPPLEMRDPKTNEVVGFDIDLANAMAKVLGVKLEWQDGAFEQMSPSLQSERVDMILSGMYDLPKRRASFDFIDYLKTGGQFYIPKDLPDIKTPTDLCGQTISTSRGTNFPDTTKAWSDKHCVAAGKPPITIITDTDLGQEVNNIKVGRAVAGVQGLETIPSLIAMNDNAYVPLGEPISSTLMGMAFKNTNTQLRDAFAYALKQVIADGTYAALIKKWGLDLSADTDVSINAGPAP